MITNYKCDNCSHQTICKNKSTLDKFNPDSKKFIGIDIIMENCIDFCPVAEAKDEE